MIQILRIVANRIGQSFVFCFFIAAVACQESNSQSQQAIGQRLPGADINLPTTFYLTRFSYTSEAWARMIKNPEDRRIAARKYIESVGGKLEGFWYAFGEYDGYCLWQAPNNVSMAAVGFAISGGGSLSKFETTVLLTVDETLIALRRADSIGYRPPAAK